MKKSTIFLFAFLVVKMVLQYVLVNPVYDLQRDEFLHLDQAKHLAWGYHSVPPVTSWISWLILQFGNGIFWIKFFPALFGALTIAVVWKTVEVLKGGLFACILAATALLLSALLRINMLYQPNSLDILSWTLLYYCLIRFIEQHNFKWLYFLAISFAIGFLNKYNTVFCLLGLLPALLLTTHRKLFLEPQFYLAILLALVLISPNLIWQFQNDFPVFKNMKELSDTQLVHVNRIDFLKEQLLFFVGSVFVLIAGLIALLIYAPFKPFRWLFFAFVFTISVFVMLKAKAYYAIGLYPILFAFGAVYLANWWQQGWKFYLRYLSLAVILLFAYPLINIAMPIYTPEKYAERATKKLPLSEHNWEDGKKHPIAQDFADMLGWSELSHKVDSVYLSIADKKHIFILCDNYGQAGAINYYTKIKGLQANSFNADYVDWLKLNQEIKTVIRIKEDDNLDNTRDLSLFEEIKEVDKIENAYAREKGTRIIILAKPKLNLAKLLQEEKAKGNLQ